MIQQIVTGSDLIEHRAHGSRRAGFVPGPLWLSAGRRHGYLPLPVATGNWPASRPR